MIVEPLSPPRTCPLPPIEGRLGGEAAHFIVEEIPAYEASGEGEHAFLFIEKEGLNTMDVVQRLAEATGRKQRDIGTAGMKDKHAVTRQWMSLLAQPPLPAQLDLGEGVRVLERRRHINKLRTGHLIGNRFELTFVDCTADDFAHAEAIVTWMQDSGIPNYFGPQRFGFGGRNLRQAASWLSDQVESQRTSATGEAMPPESPDPAARQGGRGRKRRRKPGRFDNKLHPTVIQSEFFNRYLSGRTELAEPLLRGEVVRLDGTSSHFVVEDIEREHPRFARGDLWKSGELPGGKTVHAEGEAAELERAIFRQMEIDDALENALRAAAPGARRDLLLRPQALELSSPTSNSLRLSFSLPAGSFATQVAYELQGGDWWNPR